MLGHEYSCEGSGAGTGQVAKVAKVIPGCRLLVPISSNIYKF